MLFVFLLGLVVYTHATPLDDYVWAPDDAYSWTYMPEKTYNNVTFGHNFTVYVINMTSQKWLTDADFDPSSQAQSIWWHILAVIVPDNLRFTRNASLWITNGYNHIPDADGMKEDENIWVCSQLAVITGSIVGSLFQKVQRREDQTIAFTWAHFLNNPTDPNWLIRFPMVKASVKAMDTMTAFVEQNLPQLNCKLDYFHVSGSSKRGWTTYLVGAVNPSRVRTIVPVVLDAINFIAVMHHEYRSFGGWGYALEDYRDMNITYRFDDPNVALLQYMVDPYFYRDRLTMPKFVVSAAMDEFMMPDDTRSWWDDMPEPKYFMLAPNTEHEMPSGLAEIVPAIGAWILAHNMQQSLPKFEWTIDNDSGEIVATLDYDGPIVDATLWWSYSCGVNSWDGNRTRRDFRIFHLDDPCLCGYAMNFDNVSYCVNNNAAWWNKDIQPTVVNGKRVQVIENQKQNRIFVDVHHVYKSTTGVHFPKPNDGTWVASIIVFKFYNPNNVTVNMDEMKQPYQGYGKSRMFKKPKILDSWPLPEDLGGYLMFNTEASIYPNTFPYGDCSGLDCNQHVV